MRLGTKILLLTLAATVGLSGTVIWLVTRDVTARETDRARHTIKAAVSGYFQSVDARHQRDAQLVRLLMENPVYYALLDPLESGDAEQKRFARGQLSDEIFGKHLFNELSYGDITPAFQVVLNARGQALLAIAHQKPELGKSLLAQSWPVDDAIAQPQTRKYLWLENNLYLALAVQIKAINDPEPTH